MMRNVSSRKVTTMRKRPIAGRYLLRGAEGVSKKQPRLKLRNPYMWANYIRFNRLAHCVEHVLDLASLSPDGIQGTRLGCVLTGTPKGGLSANAIATRTSHLRHCALIYRRGCSVREIMVRRLSELVRKNQPAGTSLEGDLLLFEGGRLVREVALVALGRVPAKLIQVPRRESESSRREERNEWIE